MMLFVMFCEVFYLLFWATVGFAFSGGSLPPAFALVPWLAAGAVLVFVAWLLYFRGTLWPGSDLRDKPILHAFRAATVRHYALFVALRSPALLAAVIVYTVALRLFGVEASFLSLLGYLPVVFFAAAVPTPMRACRHHVLGDPLSRERGPDGRLRLRAAQLLHPVQRPDRGGVLAAGATGAVRLGACAAERSEAKFWDARSWSGGDGPKCRASEAFSGR